MKTVFFAFASIFAATSALASGGAPKAEELVHVFAGRMEFCAVPYRASDEQKAATLGACPAKVMEEIRAGRAGVETCIPSPDFPATWICTTFIKPEGEQARAYMDQLTVVLGEWYNEKYGRLTRSDFFETSAFNDAYREISREIIKSIEGN